MGIFDKAVAKVIHKIKSDGDYEYNAILAPGRQEALRDRFTRTMLINSVWYGGNDLELKQLYERDLKAFKIGNFTSEELNYFWAQNTTDTNIRKLHSGIPQLIAEKMVDLILANGYEVNVYQDKDFENRDDDNQERLESITKYNKFITLIQESIETETWSGGVAFKLSANQKYKYPIIEVIQPEEYEPEIEAGRIVGDIFIKYFTRHNNTYKLKEHYGIDESGGYIKYSLYKRVYEDWMSCPLKELDETKDLKDISFKGIYRKFSIYKPNKLPNSEFRGSRLGESDYSGSHGLFDAIDETLSALVQEFRDGKIKNFWASNLLPVDPITQQVYLPPALKKDFVIYKGGIGQGEQPDKIEQIQGEIHSEKYIETYKKLIEAVLNNAGLSPQTIGVTGLESVSASEGSQELREKTSIRTREKKIDGWTPTLIELFELCLMLDDLKNGRSVGEYYIDVVFNDYKIETLQDKTAIAGAGLTSGTWDIKSAVDYVHNEMTDEEKILTRVNIKIERGITAFTKEEEIVYKKYMAEVEQEITDDNVDDIVDEVLDDQIEDTVNKEVDIE
jgi:hypothetical protein